MQYSIVTNIVDFILRIIDTEEDFTMIVEKLKTMKPYIIRLAAVGRQVRNREIDDNYLNLYISIENYKLNIGLEKK